MFESKHASGPWRLSETELAACGISRRKAFAIVSFGNHFEDDPKNFESWSDLEHEALVLEVGKFWGLSRWSADILALSYFGSPDVFPMSDGTLNRAIKAAIAHTSVPLNEWSIQAASPYRSYLARYLWKSIDTGYWNSSAKSFGKSY
jgi:DNA-3-methyladenine glycosylase II